ncbi:hypothetical protein FRB99_002926, partial [Tulasnella sp. 403]
MSQNKRVLTAILWPSSGSTFTESDARTAALKLRTTISSSSSPAVQDAIGYANYTDVFASMNDTDEQARRVFGSNYPRLQEVKAKWDPEGEIKSSFKGTFLSTDEEGYDISKWAENTVRPAKYVATALCVEDIVQAIKFARANGLPLAIRGGGHKMSDSSSSDGGILIDLRKMDEVRVDQDARVAYVHGGTNVRQLNLETIKYGLATPNGNCSSVGVIGFAIGGGMSLLVGEHGMAVDNIVSATVVLANGDVVQANENENPDLFWGIRGGGSNFGVVAELGLRLSPQRKDVYMCQYMFAREKLPALVNAVNEWRKTQKPYQGIWLMILLGPDGNPYVGFGGFSNSDKEEAEQSFKPILDLGPVLVQHGPMPYEDTSKVTDELARIPSNKVGVGADIDVFDVATIEKVYDAWLEITKSGAPGSAILYEFHSFDKMANVPVEATAFAQRHPHQRVLAVVFWPSSGSTFTESDARTAALKLRTTISSSSSSAVQDAIGFANHTDIFSSMNDTDEQARRLFGSNYPRLQEVKAKWDPE